MTRLFLGTSTNLERREYDAEGNARVFYTVEVRRFCVLWLVIWRKEVVI
jgi:hypothetical protein